MNTFGQTFEEGFDGEGWKVTITQDSTAVQRVGDTRHQSQNRYYASGMANVYANKRFWMIAPFVQETLSNDLQTTLRSYGFPNATVMDYPWPLIAGETLFAFGHVGSYLIGVESAEEDAEGDSTFGALGAVGFALILVAIIIASVGAIVVYREWVRRQVPIGHIDQKDQPQVVDPKPSTHGAYVDHVAGHFEQVAGYSESSEESQGSNQELSEQSSNRSFDEMDTFHDSHDSLDSNGSLDGATGKEDWMADGELSLDDCKELDFAVRFFEANRESCESLESLELPQRSVSDLSAASEPPSAGGTAPSA